MDPNEALKQLRELLGDGTTFIDVHPEELSDHLGMACEYFQALDEWIQKGGFLPREWQFDKWTKESGLSIYRVHCLGHVDEVPSCGPQHLTEEQYGKQLGQAHKRWRCPVCRAEATWDDDWYESAVVAMGGENVE